MHFKEKVQTFWSKVLWEDHKHQLSVNSFVIGLSLEGKKFWLDWQLTASSSGAKNSWFLPTYLNYFLMVHLNTISWPFQFRLTCLFLQQIITLCTSVFISCPTASCYHHLWLTCMEICKSNCSVRAYKIAFEWSAMKFIFKDWCFKSSK